MPHGTITHVVWLLSLLAAAGADTAEFERSVAYNTLPWAYSIGKALLFALAPTTRAPTLPELWLSANGTAPRVCPFVPGAGFMVALHYDSSPVGPYNELFASTGMFECACGGQSKPLPSLQRIWVDADSPGGAAARTAGHRIFGIPKRVGSFAWRGSGGQLGVRVEDVATGDVVLDVDTTQVRGLGRGGLQLLGWMHALTAHAVHWPVHASRVGGNRTAGPGEVPAYAVAEAAASSGTPIRAGLKLDLGAASVVKPRLRSISAAALTGWPDERLALLPLGLRLPENTPALLLPPQLLC